MRSPSRDQHLSLCACVCLCIAGPSCSADEELPVSTEEPTRASTESRPTASGEAPRLSGDPVFPG